MRTFKADPHTITTKKKPFEQILRETYRRPLEDFDSPNTRWGSNRENFLLLHELRDEPKALIGTVFHLRRTDLELTANPTRIYTEELKADEGRGRHVAFLFDRERKVLWFQRDRSTLTISPFADYLADKADAEFSYRLRLQDEAIGRALKLKRIKSISVAISRGDAEGNGRLSKAVYLSQFFKMKDLVGGARIEIKITPERGEFLGPKAKDYLEETARLIDEGVDGIKRAVVNGEVDGALEATTIDLISDKYLCSVEAEEERFRQPETLMSLIKGVWQKNRGVVK